MANYSRLPNIPAPVFPCPQHNSKTLVIARDRKLHVSYQTNAAVALQALPGRHPNLRAPGARLLPIQLRARPRMYPWTGFWVADTLLERLASPKPPALHGDTYEIVRYASPTEDGHYELKALATPVPTRATRRITVTGGVFSSRLVLARKSRLRGWLHSGSLAARAASK